MSVQEISRNVTTLGAVYEYADFLTELKGFMTPSGSSFTDQEARLAGGELRLANLRMTHFSSTSLSTRYDTNEIDLKTTHDALKSSIGAAKAGFESYLTGTTTLSALDALLDDVKTKVEAVQGNLSGIAIRDGIVEHLFFEYYRAAEVMNKQQVGQLGERLQVSEKFLDSLNLVYQGATWNPGEEYITLEGELQDVSLTDKWHDKFLEDGINTNMSDGVAQLRTMYEAGLLPPGSQEHDTATAIFNLWDTSFAEGGYGAIATQDYVARMWSDKQFQRTLQDGINGASHLNERLQHDISKILMDYDTFTRSAATMATRMNASMRTIARSIQGNN